MKTGHKAKGWSRGQLARLACDTAGNTMLMMAAAMFPIIGIAGSAFDMGRAYMVKSRLQQACDAGALAGRRAMTAADFDDDTVAKAEASKFFNSNYPQGSFGSTGAAFTPTGTDDGQVTASATATVPMTLMRLFNVPSLAMTVACDARLEIANADIMFVLDTTGSMDWDAAGNDVNGGSTSRIVALRSAVMGFYDVLDSAMSDTARVRYGFVPFSSGVNVGGLLQANWLKDQTKYQSRLANYNTPDYTVGSTATLTKETYADGSGNPISISQNNCSKYGRNESFSGFNPAQTGNPVQTGGGPPPAATTHITYSNDSDAGDDWGWTDTGIDSSGGDRSCRRKRVQHVQNYTGRYKFTNWTFKKEVPYDTSQFKTGGSVTMAFGKDGTMPAAGQYNPLELAQQGTGVTTTSVNWSNKCIEERKTLEGQATFPDNADDLKTSPYNQAWDLDIDMIPTSDPDTRWAPAWSRVVFNRNSYADVNSSNDGSNPTTYCPAAARKLDVMTRGDVQTYVNALNPVGSTYLDLGIIWGGRLVSPTGLFAADNATAPNRRQINRHVIFMTDGAMQPNSALYGTYGYEKLDRRITGPGQDPDNNDLALRHLERFRAVCEAIKARNVMVWTVSFATAQTPEMVACASPGKALAATTTEQLKQRFKEIATRIAELRLSK